ncbi:hypothetical protein DFH09DRAFT_1394867 [Mycena vulgaris]|nr:hypothetical protein DFH09DRAFT_1394867 [Mycena vulgaris]
MDVQRTSHSSSVFNLTRPWLLASPTCYSSSNLLYPFSPLRLLYVVNWIISRSRHSRARCPRHSQFNRGGALFGDYTPVGNLIRATTISVATVTSSPIPALPARALARPSRPPRSYIPPIAHPNTRLPPTFPPLPFATLPQAATARSVAGYPSEGSTLASGASSVAAAACSSLHPAFTAHPLVLPFAPPPSAVPRLPQESPLGPLPPSLGALFATVRHLQPTSRCHRRPPSYPAVCAGWRMAANVRCRPFRHLPLPTGCCLVTIPVSIFDDALIVMGTAITDWVATPDVL